MIVARLLSCLIDVTNAERLPSQTLISRSRIIGLVELLFGKTNIRDSETLGRKNNNVVKFVVTLAGQSSAAAFKEAKSELACVS
jgi:hypothetical protein